MKVFGLRTASFVLNIYGSVGSQMIHDPKNLDHNGWMDLAQNLYKHF